MADPSESKRPDSERPIKTAEELLTAVSVDLRFNHRFPEVLALFENLKKEIETCHGAPTERQLNEFNRAYDRLVFGFDLVLSARKGNAAAAWPKIDLGADIINFQDPKTGATALHYAAAYGSRALLRLLIAQPSCDYLVKDHQGRRAWQVANRAGNISIMRLLHIKARKQAEAEGIPFTRTD